jgi:hypothetical protein
MAAANAGVEPIPTGSEGSEGFDRVNDSRAVLPAVNGTKYLEIQNPTLPLPRLAL